MRRHLFILSVLLIAAYSDRQPEKSDEATDSQETYGIQDKQDTLVPPPPPQLVTPEFFQLVKYIDSVGFIYNAARFVKTYPEGQGEQVNIDGNYLFYVLSPDEVVPFASHKKEMDDLAMNLNEMDSLNYQRQLDYINRWKLNIALFEKVERITAYFFVEKSFFNRTGKGTYNDGLIEEWKFPDTQSAKDAAFDLSKKETMVYFNRGAYVCFLNNYMYVFHSRSAGFYTPLKKFWTWFADKNRATIPNEREQRKVY